MKRESSRAVIIENNKLLVLFRRKIDSLGNKKEYLVIPGGGIEENESKEDTVLRELKEELNIDIKINGFLGTVEKEKTIENYFDCEIINGVPKLGGEELDRMTESNYYEVMFIEINDLNNYDFEGMDIVNKAINKDYE